MSFKRMKPARRPGAAPAGPQIDAEMRRAYALKQSGRPDDAEELLEELHRRYPKRLEPLHLLLDMAKERRDMFAYQEIIERMVAIAPDNADFALAQAGGAMSSGLLGLALERFKRCLERWPRHPEAEQVRGHIALLEESLVKMMDEAGLKQPDRFELAARNDEIQFALSQGRYDEVRTLAHKLLDRHAMYAPALNNLTVACILEGNFEEALPYTERVLEFDPDNVHALANKAHSLLALGRREEAAAAAERMKRSTAYAADKAGKIMEALSYLGDDAGVLAAYRKAIEAKDDSFIGSAIAHHLAAAAAQRLGQEKEAQQYWKEALKQEPAFSLAKENLADLKRRVGERHAPWSFSLHYWINQDTLRDFAARMDAANGSNSDDGLTDAFRVYLQNHPAIESAIPILLERGDPPGRQFALLAAKTAKTPKMLEALRDFALSRNGPDNMRMEAANVAAAAGLIERGKARLWMQGEWRDVILMDWDIYTEPEGEHTPQVEKLATEAMNAIYKGDGKRAETLLEQAIEIEPNAPDLWNNLVSAYRVQDRADDANELVLQVHERFPDYFFGKINMAHYYIEKDRLAEAGEMLTPLLSQRRIHIAEFTALAQVHILLLLARDERDSARSWYELWKRVDPDHPLLEQFRLHFEMADLFKPEALQSLFRGRRKRR